VRITVDVLVEQEVDAGARGLTTIHNHTVADVGMRAQRSCKRNKFDEIPTRGSKQTLTPAAENSYVGSPVFLSLA
jgi:hypothetical protein